jgi:hypothetical protein
MRFPITGTDEVENDSMTEILFWLLAACGWIQADREVERG